MATLISSQPRIMGLRVTSTGQFCHKIMRALKDQGYIVISVQKCTGSINEIANRFGKDSFTRALVLETIMNVIHNTPEPEWDPESENLED